MTAPQASARPSEPPRSFWSRLAPEWLQGYRPSWLGVDVVAGLTLAAVAIPEVMGYTSIAQTPVVTGLYTIIFPTLLFALLGSSRLLVVGADSATAAILAAGLGGLGIAGLTPNSPEWLAMASLTALVCGVLLVIARLLRLGFLGDFLSASVLIGFLTGVGIQVFSGQLPDMLGIEKGTGNWFQQQWHLITNLGSTNLTTLVYALVTLVIVLGCKIFAPRVPGAIIAVVLTIAASTILDSKANGVAIIGAVQGGFPPISLPAGIEPGDVLAVLGTALSCFVLIIAQSAATSRSFAMRHGQKVDVNRDIVGLAGANLAAGLTGTFVVNGSPTKTQILDEQKGRTQVANIAMALTTLVVVLFLTQYLTDMPKAVLGAIVFLIGVDLIDIKGLRRIWLARRSEFVIALVTAIVVFSVGVEQGIILAIVLSILEIIRRLYSPKRFVVDVGADGTSQYASATPGVQSEPGLIVFRYDADLFFANANRFSDDVQRLITAAPDPVRWLVLDCSSITDVDYSAAAALGGLIQFVHGRDGVFALAALDPDLTATLREQKVLEQLNPDHIYPTTAAAVAGFHAASDPGGPPAS